jgi:DNA-3-methyladenine glycosylase
VLAGYRPGKPFPCRLLASDSLTAARSLLGARLVRKGDGIRVGRIVEVEAYIGQDDLASHARFGRTRRNAVMFGPSGVAYVYLVYGMYNCLNVVTEANGRPAALLVRAVEPLLGMELMRQARLSASEARLARRSSDRRERERARLRALPDDALASGPGLVCDCFSIGPAEDALDLCDPASTLCLGEAPRGESRGGISSGPRIGIGYAPEPWLSRPWRFWLTGNPAVSR